MSAAPDALVLFNLVTDNSEKGFGHDRVKERWVEFSPMHNITEWDWKHKDPADGTGTANTYAFTYDKLSRLTDTRQYEGASTNPIDQFVERDMAYDKNGNFTALKRYSAGTLTEDIADPVYNGNQISTIKNNGVSYVYEYDSNGNCTTDGLNALKLEYNYLN